MPSTTFCAIALLLATAYARDTDRAIENDRIDNEAFESFGSPVYGPSGKSIDAPVVLKTGYPGPAVPASYAAYLNNAAFGSIYGYNRFGYLPYSAYYNSPYNAALNYGYGPGYLSGLGYGAALPYSSALMARSAYGPYYPGYSGLGYRYGALRAAAALNAIAAPLNAVSAPLNAAPFAAAPLAGISAAVAGYPTSVPVPGYRSPLVPTTGKDGSLRYAYAPAAYSAVPFYKK